MANNDDIRNSIVNAARIIFSKYGYGKTTMDDIALALGKGKSSIYYYFQNKKEVFQAVVEYEVMVLKSTLHKSVKRKKHARGKLKAYILTRVNCVEMMVNYHTAVKSEYLSQFDFIESIRSMHDQEEVVIVQEILEEGVRQGDFIIDNPLLASVAIVTSLKGFEIPLYIREKKEKDTERRVDKLLKMILYGISKN